jgi:hypothetical protein
MFSTMESGATRTMRVRLVKNEGSKTLSLPVTLPVEMRPVAEDLLQRPTQRAASNLSLMLSNVEWLEAPELDAIYAMPPSALASLALSSNVSGGSTPLLKDVLRKPRAWIKGLKSSATFGAGRPVDFAGTTVEVWQLKFDCPTRRLTLEQLSVATEPRRGPPAEGGSS